MVLRANTAGQAGSGRLRNALVVLQFAVSIGLGIAAVVVFGQISFARNIDLGFRKDNVLIVAGNGLLTIGGREGLLQQLRSNPDILDLVEPRLRPGAFVLADNAGYSPDYLARVRSPANGYMSIPFAADVELSMRTG